MWQIGMQFADLGFTVFTLMKLLGRDDIGLWLACSTF